ncbi:hypothetical protein HELRODRAFT_100558 [Helobdella robusta]|uniref:Sulfatase-modifying factor enzyme-like domain-containing protein n=1 Tax=Helobdella robusta TaxID=6412 RepID=T1ED04_HELRO|nr:hypothetical protein HELRODRAFT_100558 [Helobdella robusta]ESO01221.1 hypothetical protein HELRODRAFT_100558 [Helobdella robusta]
MICRWQSLIFNILIFNAFLLTKIQSGSHDTFKKPETSDCGCSAANRQTTTKAKADSDSKNPEVLKSINSKNIKLYDEMVPVEGGIYGIGSYKPIIPADGEGPARKVKLARFWLDVHEVSNLQFSEFVQQTGYVTEAERFGNSYVIETFISEEVKSSINQAVAAAPWWLPVNGADWMHPTGPDSNITHLMDHPVVHVSWNDATAFCKWKSKRLPREAEWESACRNNKQDRLFPWGNLEKPKDHHYMNIWHGSFPTENTKDDGYASTCPVWSYPNQTTHGLKNMIGNVWEWVADWWQANHHHHQDHHPDRHQEELPVNPAGPPGGSDKVKKGGSFMCTKQHCYRYRCGARSSNTPDSSAYNLGFRCARDDDDDSNDNDSNDNDDVEDIHNSENTEDVVVNNAYKDEI